MGLSTIKNLSKNSGLAVSLSEAKAQCYIVENDPTNDALLTSLIKSAQVIIEESPSVPFVFFKNTFEAIFDAKGSLIRLPKMPVKSVDSVELYNGTDWTETSDYTAELGDTMAFVIMPSLKGKDTTKVKIIFTAGESDAENIRYDAKQLVLLNVANLFDNRNAIDTKALSENPLGYSAILKNFQYYNF